MKALDRYLKELIAPRNLTFTMLVCVRVSSDIDGLFGVGRGDITSPKFLKLQASWSTVDNAARELATAFSLTFYPS